MPEKIVANVFYKGIKQATKTLDINDTSQDPPVFKAKITGTGDIRVNGWIGTAIINTGTNNDYPGERIVEFTSANATSYVVFKYTNADTFLTISLPKNAVNRLNVSGPPLVEVVDFGERCNHYVFGSGFSTGLVKVPSTLPAAVTSTARMFYSCSNFNQNINNWDVSRVTDMSNMFDGALSFNQPLNNWDVSKVTNMSSMFAYQTKFNQDISMWRVSKVSNMDKMFDYFTSFNQDISKWCVPLITSEPYSFRSAGALANVNCPVWGTCPRGY